MTDPASLGGKVALVTGAAGGIGRATALELARRGARVALSYRRSPEAADAVVGSIERAGGEARAFGCDVTQADAVRAMFGEVTAAFGRLDVLVNNAGDLVARRDVAAMTEDVFRQVFEVNVLSTWLCCQAALPSLTEGGGGAIVNMSSLAAHNGGGPGAFAYAAAKAAIIAMTKAMARELAPRGIRVNAVAPGLIGDTEFHARYTAPDAFAASARTVPLGRAGTPDEVARVIAFLACEESSYLTGETIDITGGLYMR
jgi:3-oxoacyl-[acyl-carrier protein] reductase